MNRCLVVLVLSISLSACGIVRLQPVLEVAQECPVTQDLPYLLDSTISDEELVCISVWRERPLDTVQCVNVGTLKAVIAGLKGS